MIKSVFKIVRFVVLLLSVSLLFNGCHSRQKKKVLKVAHILDPSHSVHKAMLFMAERLREKSGGKMELQIYPSGQLGSERGCLELLQIGSLAITKVSAAVMEGFIEDYKVLGLPYIFRDKEHAFQVLDGETGKQLLLSGEDIWLRGLCFYDAGSRSFYTKDKPIHSPDDLKGLKIRVMKSITATNMVKSLGGSPTPISWGELYTALQSGVVDGAENNPPSFYLSHHYEVCRYYSIDEHTTIPDVLLISTIIWNKLSEEEKQWLQEAADESALVQREYWAESEREALEGVQEAGVTVIYPDKREFVEKVEPLYEELRSNKRLNTLVEKIRNQESEIENLKSEQTHEEIQKSN
jgi:tripartite ATP-independent transporter DctP family solute receptor